MTGQIEFDTRFDINWLVDLSLSVGILIQSARNCNLECRLRRLPEPCENIILILVLKLALRARFHGVLVCRVHGVLVCRVQGTQQTITCARDDIV